MSKLEFNAAHFKFVDMQEDDDSTSRHGPSEKRATRMANMANEYFNQWYAEQVEGARDAWPCEGELTTLHLAEPAGWTNSRIS